MDSDSKKESIKARVEELLNDSFIDAQKMVNKALNSGAIDIESWDAEINSWVLPKIIVTAILKRASENYEGKGTDFEKQIKKETNNLKHFL
jgi:hypothetical protein